MALVEVFEKALMITAFVSVMMLLVEYPTYAGVFAFLGLPVAFMPLLGGTVAAVSSFKTLFLLTTVLLFGAVFVVSNWNRRTEMQLNKDRSGS